MFVPQLSSSSDLSSNAVEIFEVLVGRLVLEHIDYAVELGLLGEPAFIRPGSVRGVYFTKT